MSISILLGLPSHFLVLELVKHLIIGSVGSNLLIFLCVSPHDLFCILFLLHHLLVSQSVIVLLCDSFIVEFTLRYLVMNLIKLVSHSDSIHTAHYWLSSCRIEAYVVIWTITVLIVKERAFRHIWRTLLHLRLQIP